MPPRITDSATSSRRSTGKRVDAMKGGQRQSVRHAQLHQEAPRIDLDRLVGASQAAADRAFDPPPQP